MSSQHALAGRIGAFRTHATHDVRETTANARAAFLARFEAEVDPSGELPADERARRAEAARRAYFARLAYQSAAARAKKGAASPKKATPQEVERASAHTTARAA